MAGAEKTVTEFEFRYTTTGVEEARRKTDAVGASLDKLAGSETRSTEASDKAAKARERMAAAQARAQRQMEAELRAYEQMRVAQEMMRQATDAMADAQRRQSQAQAEAARSANENTVAANRQAEALKAAAVFAVQHPLLVAAGTAVAARSLGGLATTASGSLAAASLATAKYANENVAMGGAVSGAAGVASRALGGASTAAAAAGAGLTGFGDKITGLGGSVGFLARGLGAVGPLFLPIAAGLAVFSAASAALDKANADLAKLITLGQQAERLDISAPFLKAFTGIGAQFRIEAEQMAAALQRASGFLQDRFGQASAATRAFGDVDPGGTLRASQQLALAQSTEERIRAVLAGMAELEARGQRLAAIRVGESVFGADLVERLRRGEQSVGRFVEELDRARGKEVLTQADVTRAVELDREIADVKRQIDEAVSATFDFSAAAVKLNEVWLGILKPVRDVTQAIAESVSGGDAAILRQIQGLQERQRFIQDVSIPREIAGPNRSSVLDSLRSTVDGLQGQIDRLSSTGLTAALEKIDSAAGRVAPAMRVVSDEMVRMSLEADAAKSRIPGLDGALANLGASAAQAAAKIENVAAGLRSLQNLNPNLSGALSYLDKVNQVQAVYERTLATARAEFEKTGNEPNRMRDETAAVDERTRALKALAEQRDKPVADIVKEADRSQLSDLDRQLAQIGDRFAETRRQREEMARVLVAAATPEDADKIRRQFETEAAKLDGAQKALTAKARADEARRQTEAASSGGGADAYDNALARARDQIKELELQAQTADKAAAEVVKLTEANRLRRAADAAGRGSDAGVAEEIERVAEALAKQKTATDAAIEAQRRMQDGTRALGDETTRFLDGFLLGTESLTASFDSLSRSLASSGLQGLLTGQGSLAGMLGTAPKEKGELGGLLGGQFPSFLRDAVKDGAEKGTAAGAQSGLSFLTDLGGVSGKQLLQGAAGLALIGGSYSIGRQQKGAVGIAGGVATGAIGGAMLGAQLGAGLGPAGAAIGAGIGLIGSLMGQSEARKQRQDEIKAKLAELKDAYDQQKGQIEIFRAGLRGEATQGTEGAIRQAYAQAVQANVVASRGGDQATADQIMREAAQFADRMREQVRATAGGIAEEIEAGFGPSGPYAAAAASVRQLGEAMRSWLDDVNRAQDAFSGEGLDAIYKGLLATLQPTPELSQTAREFSRIMGTAAALQQELTRLSGSAEGAAASIREGVGKALDALRSTFDSDLDTKINDARGQGYVNDVRDLLKEIGTLRSDAGLIGGDLGKVDLYFSTAAQKIVTDSQITGEAFDALIGRFPELTGVVSAYSAAVADQASTLEQAAERIRGYQDRRFAAQNDGSTLDGALAAFQRQAEQDRAAEVKAGGQGLADLEAAQAAERLRIMDDFAARAAAAEKATADRRLGYADRLFAAANDNSTLEGQLAAYDRKAAQERAAEIEAGGQALIDLAQAQAAERLRIERDYYQQVADAQAQAMEQARTAFETFAKGIRTFLDGLTAGAGSPLAPQARLSAAQSQYDAQLALAHSGDRTALDGITQYASNLLDASKAYNASSSAFQATFQAVQQQLAALPTQVSAEQFIVDAIKDSKAGTISATVAMQAALKTAIDAGNGAAVAGALLPQFNSLTAATGGLLNYDQFVRATGGLATVGEQQSARAIFNAIDQNGDGQIDKMEAVRAQAFQVSLNTIGTNGLLGGTNTRVDGSNVYMKEANRLLDAVISWTSAVNTSVGAVNGTTSNVKGAVDTAAYWSKEGKAVLDGVNIQTFNTSAALNTSNETLKAIKELNDTSKGQLQLLNTQFTNSTVTGVGGAQISNTQISALNKIAYNTALTDGARNAGAGQYARGGLVTGPGSGTSDSIAAFLSNGEYVLTAEATRRLGVPLLDAMNDNRLRMQDLTQPHFAMPVPVPLPMPAPSAGSDGIREELQALRAEVISLRKERQQGDNMVARAVVAGAEHVAEQVGDRVEKVSGAIEDSNRETRMLGLRPARHGTW